MNEIKKVLEFMTIGAVLYNADGVVNYVNPIFCKLFKTSLKRINGKKISSDSIDITVSNDDIDYIIKNYKFIDNKIIKLQDINGFKWVKINSIQIKNGEDHFILLFDDISETIGYSFLYKEIFNNSNTGIMILNTINNEDFYIDDINPIGLKILKTEKEKIVKKEIKKINFSKIENKTLYEHIKEVWNTNKLKVIKFSKCESFKTPLWLNIQIIQLDNRDVIIMFDDVTEIVESRKKLEEANKQKSVFLSNMSHEIRSPINSIVGFADMLPDLTNNETRQEYVDIIISSSKYLLKLIDDILDMSKIEAGKISISKKSFDVNEKMKEIYLLNRNKIKKDIEFILTTPIDDLKIFNDDYRFMQIFINMITNAIKFTNEGEIEMGYTQEDNHIFFYVRDTGMGIKDEDKDKIFKRYEQVQKSSKLGSGLGLAISNELVKLMGGEMWLESNYGVGSTFFFKLPLNKRGKYINKKSITEIVETLDLTDKKILLVEDNDYNIKLIKSYLENTKANVIVAVDGNDALLKYNENKNDIDLILMDIQISEMDGNEVTQIIRTIDQSTPIIAQTAFAMKEEVDDIMQNGFDNLIRKPIRKEELYKMISKYI